MSFELQTPFSMPDILRPLPENAARVRAARAVPHPMDRSGLDFERPRVPQSVLTGDLSANHDLWKAPLGIHYATVAAPGWPQPMSQAAFHGPAGDFVRLAAPHTEADPAALLMAFLVGVGCMMGRTPHYQVEDSRHGMNLFTVFVGETSKARKGTATDRALKLLREIDPVFMSNCCCSGLASGEGLIEQVRDPREDDVPIKSKDGTELRFERRVVDDGVADKRLLVVESEFGSVLQQTGREGNILSAVLRDCWDGRPLRILARSNKDRCEEPHIALIGNVTVEELKRLLTTNDRANGFGNRILWCCSRRSKLLPRGGRPVDPAAVAHLAARVRAAVEWAATAAAVGFDDEAGDAWDLLYAELAEGASGLFGSMTARAEAQVVRLATLYALLDRSSIIRLEHLRAAQEVWGYCEESVRSIFGDALGDETADAISKALHNAPQGLTQTEISRLFAGHKPAAELQRALTLLQGKGLVAMQRESGAGGGPTTRWCRVAQAPS